MNSITIFPSHISGTIRAPSSKSATHREFILSAIACGTSVISYPLHSADTLATLKGIQALGAQVCCSSNVVSITGGNLHSAQEIIDCRNSGTTLRMLVSLAATLNGTTRFTGDASLMNRPMEPLILALKSCGATIVRENNIISVTGPIIPKLVDIAGNISSQFVSALLIAGCSVHLTTSLVSAPYVDMTIAALESRGCSIAISSDTYLVNSRVIAPLSCTIEGDWSSAAYLLAAGALVGSITVTGLSSVSLQGDKQIVEILQKMGASITQTDEAVRVAVRPLHPIDCNLKATPDLFPIVALLAANANGTSRLYGVAHLIYKESNRLQRTADMLGSLGISISLDANGCSITGGQLSGVCISAGGDHRMFMTAVVAGLVAHGPVEITDAENEADVSYPYFLHDICELGGILR